MASRNLQDLQPPVREAAYKAIDDCEEAGVHVLVTCTFRDGKEQAALYAQGRTAPGKIVTNAKPGESFHQYKVALDVVPMRNGKCVWDAADPAWVVVGEKFKAHGFEWGAEWRTFKERPHFQMTGGHPLSFFQNGGKL